MRVGIGYDIHRLEEGRELILGGVKIPFEFGLAGHSDADVLVHSICDALLGALALGDIGQHFPNTDAQYRGISSLVLLGKVKSLIRDQGFAINNVDSWCVTGGKDRVDSPAGAFFLNIRSWHLTRRQRTLYLDYIQGFVHIREELHTALSGQREMACVARA